MTTSYLKSALDVSMAPTNNSTAKAHFSFPKASRFDYSLKPLYTILSLFLPLQKLEYMLQYAYHSRYQISFSRIWRKDKLYSQKYLLHFNSIQRTPLPQQLTNQGVTLTERNHTDGHLVSVQLEMPTQKYILRKIHHLINRFQDQVNTQ